MMLQAIRLRKLGKRVLPVALPRFLAPALYQKLVYDRRRRVIDTEKLNDNRKALVQQ